MPVVIEGLFGSITITTTSVAGFDCPLPTILVLLVGVVQEELGTGREELHIIAEIVARGHDLASDACLAAGQSARRNECNQGQSTRPPFG